MGPARGVVEVVGCNNSVLDAFIVVLHAMISIVALEQEKIFYLKLIIFRPANFKPHVLLLAGNLFYLDSVEKIKYFFIVDLHE